MNFRRMRSTIAALAVMLLFLTACTTPRKEVALEAGTALCCVCQYNHDLACLKVKVTDATPRAEYEGRTMCFCSEDCRKAFVKNPRKYAAHQGSSSR